MGIDLLRKGKRWNWETIIMGWFLPIFIGMLVLGLILVIVVAAVEKTSSDNRASEAWTQSQDLISRYKGKRVVIEGFDTEGLVTGGHGTELHIYFPEVGVIHLEEDFLRVVGEASE
jgi:hypothetical protein